MPEHHLDDARITAILDGDADPASMEHARACATCQARLETFRAMQAAVASPVPPLDATTVDGLLNRALVGQVILHFDQDRRRRRLVAPSGGAVAAALVLLLGLPALVSSMSDSSDSAGSDVAFDATTTDEDAAATASPSAGAAVRSSESMTAGDSAGGAMDSAAGSSFSPDVLAIDLGDRGSVADLVRTLESSLATMDDDGAELAAPVAGQATTGSKSSATTARPAPPTTAAKPLAQCTDEARAIGAGRLGSFTYSAALRWRGEDAEVLVFLLTEPREGASRQAYVMQRATCAVLAEPTF